MQTHVSTNTVKVPRYIYPFELLIIYFLNLYVERDKILSKQIADVIVLKENNDNNIWYLVRRLKENYKEITQLILCFGCQMLAACLCYSNP